MHKMHFMPHFKRKIFWGRAYPWGRSSTFLRKKCIRVTCLEDVLTSKWPGYFATLAPPLKIRLCIWLHPCSKNSGHTYAFHRS